MKRIVIALAVLLPASVWANDWQGKVVGVSDGDTLAVLDSQNQTVKIRMVEIDAPEKTQAFGQKSKQALSDMCFGKTARVDDRGTDKYKRTLGRLLYVHGKRQKTLCCPFFLWSKLIWRICV